jgi:hypothetical protein
MVKTAGTMSLVSVDSRKQEDYERTRELQLLAGHGLQGHGEVERRDGNLRHLLERHDEAFLRNPNIVDSYTGNGEVLFVRNQQVSDTFLTSSGIVMVTLTEFGSET